MQHRRHIVTMLAAAGVMSLACSDVTSTGDPLPQADAQDVAAALVEATFAGFGGTSLHRTSTGLTMAPSATINGTQELNLSNSCDGGGTASLAGKLTVAYDDVAQTGSLSYDYKATPQECQVTTASDKVYTLTGDPSLNVKGKFDWSPTALKGGLDYSGGFTWASGDASGGCSIDISSDFDFTIDSQTQAVTGTATLSGKVCGNSISESVSIS